MEELGGRVRVSGRGRRVLELLLSKPLTLATLQPDPHRSSTRAYSRWVRLPRPPPQATRKEQHLLHRSRLPRSVSSSPAPTPSLTLDTGGNMDPIDTSPAWSSLYPALSTPEEVKLHSLKLCAVRETFEECGILLAESDSASGERVWEGVKEEERRVWRDKVRYARGAGGRGADEDVAGSFEWRCVLGSVQAAFGGGSCAPFAASTLVPPIPRQLDVRPSSLSRFLELTPLVALHET